MIARSISERSLLSPLAREPKSHISSINGKDFSLICRIVYLYSFNYQLLYKGLIISATLPASSKGG